MRTTLDLPDELFRQVKAKAALDGLSLKDLLTDYIASGLQGAGAPRQRKPSSLPVIKRRGRLAIPDLTAELQAKIQEEEDIAKLRRSFGR